MTPDAFAWVESNGGPLLLLAAGLLVHWEGSDRPSPGRNVVADFRWDPSGPATDYDRAADVAQASIIGVLPIATGRGLVLGDEPYATTWIPFDGGRGGLLVRWDYAPDDIKAREQLSRLPTSLDWQHDFVFVSPPGMHTLFDAAFPGADLPAESLRFELTAGRYGVESVWYRPNAETSFLLHRLRPA